MKLTLEFIKLLLSVAKICVCILLYYGVPSNPTWLLAAYFVFAVVFYGLWIRLAFLKKSSGRPAVEAGQGHGIFEGKKD